MWLFVRLPFLAVVVVVVVVFFLAKWWNDVFPSLLPRRFDLQSMRIFPVFLACGGSGILEQAESRNSTHAAGHRQQKAEIRNTVTKKIKNMRMTAASTCPNPRVSKRDAMT
jgi:hypothetical protein